MRLASRGASLHRRVPSAAAFVTGMVAHVRIGSLSQGVNLPLPQFIGMGTDAVPAPAPAGKGTKKLPCVFSLAGSTSPCPLHPSTEAGALTAV